MITNTLQLALCLFTACYLSLDIRLVSADDGNAPIILLERKHDNSLFLLIKYARTTITIPNDSGDSYAGKKMNINPVEIVQITNDKTMDTVYRSHYPADLMGAHGHIVDFQVFKGMLAIVNESYMGINYSIYRIDRMDKPIVKNANLAITRVHPITNLNTDGLNTQFLNIKEFNDNKITFNLKIILNNRENGVINKTIEYTAGGTD